MSHQKNSGEFIFNSPASTTHIINHNLNNLVPNVTIYIADTDEQALPETVKIVNSNTIEITTSSNSAIYGRIS